MSGQRGSSPPQHHAGHVAVLVSAGGAQPAIQRGRTLDHRLLRQAVPRTEIPRSNHYEELAGDLRSCERTL